MENGDDSVTRQGPERTRRSQRLAGWDYSETGAYFITLVTYQRECIFGEVTDGIPNLSAIGTILRDEWLRSAEIRRELTLDEFVVMPNHLHAIVFLARDRGSTETAVGAHGGAPGQTSVYVQPVRPPRSLGSLVSGFKSGTTRRIARFASPRAYLSGNATITTA